MKKYSKNSYLKYKTYYNQSNSKKKQLKETFYTCGFNSGLKQSTLRKYWYWTRSLILNCEPLLHPSQMSDNYVILFVNNLTQKDYSKTSKLQAVDSIRFLYEIVIGNRVTLVKELTKIRKNFSRTEALVPKKSFWQFIFK